MKKIRNEVGVKAKLWVNAIERPCKRNGLSHVIKPADPGYGSFDSHAEAGVGDGAVLAQVEVPLEGG